MTTSMHCEHAPAEYSDAYDTAPHILCDCGNRNGVDLDMCEECYAARAVDHAR